MDTALQSLPLSSKNVLTLTSDDLVSIAIEMEKVHIENTFNGLGVPIKEFEDFSSWIQLNFVDLIGNNSFINNEGSY